ncbi:MAG TPA: sugar-binding protein [Chthoniobacterales bacterium]
MTFPTLFRVLFPLFATAAAIQAADPGNGDFENGLDGWKTEGSISADSAEPFAGKSSLKLARDPLKVTLPTVVIGPSFPVTGARVEVSGAARSDLYFQDLSFNGTLLVEFLGQDGKPLGRQSILSVHDRTPWKAFTKQVPMLKGSVQARLVAQLEKTHGSFWLDDLTVKSIASATGLDALTRFSTKYLGNLFYPDDKVTIDLQVEPSAPLNAKAREVICTLTDYWGLPQHEPFTVTLAEKDGKYRAALDLSRLPLTVGKYYELQTRQDFGGAEPYRAAMSFAILPEAATAKMDPFSVPFGTHTWDARLTEYFYLSARLGIRRCLVFWDWPQTPPHTPHFPGWEYDVRLGHPKKSGMRPYGVLYPVSDVEHNEKQRGEEDLRAGIRQSIELFKKDGLWGFQAGNEPPSWDPEMVKRNVELYRVVYEETKKTDPNFFVIGSAIGPEEQYFKLGFGRYCDAYNVHSYGSLAELRRAMREYKEMFAKYGNAKPVYSTEIGSKSQGLSRHEIAMDVVRKAVCFLADGGGFFTWFAVTYPDKDGTRRGSYGDSMDLYGGYLNMYLPRIDAVAYYHIINAIGDRKFVQEKESADATSRFLFRNDRGEALQVLWNMKQTVDAFVPLPGVKAVRLIHLDGSERTLDAGGKGVTLRVGEEPQLLLYSSAEKELAPELPPPALSLAELPASMVEGNRAQITVQVAADEKGAVTLAPPPGWKTAPGRETPGANGRRTVVFDVEVPAGIEAREASMAILLQEKGREPGGELSFRVPLASMIEASIAPQAANAAQGEGRIQLTVTNRGGAAQAVHWDVEILQEIPLKKGEFRFGDAETVKAHFTDVTEGSLNLGAGGEKHIEMKLAQVDPLTIYRIQARARDAAGKSVITQRLVSGFVGVPHAPAGLKVDGHLDEPEWKKASAQAIHLPRQFYQAEKGAEWSGPEDLSGTLRFLWDEKYLYVGVEVADDVFSNPKQDGNLWSQDGLQFLIDPARDRKEKKGRYDFSVGLGQKGPQAWSHLSGDQVRSPEGEIKDFQLAIRREGQPKGHAVYEVAIPWTRIPPFQPAVGRDLGLSLILNEDDGKARFGFMAWFSGVHLKEMDHVGDLILTK